LATVTSVLRRAAAPFAVVTALVAGLTACGTGPSQVNSAVILDDHVISVDEVQAIVDKVVKEQPAARSLAQQHKLDLVAREAVTQLVTHRLLTQAAADEDLSVDQEQLRAVKKQDPFDEDLPTDGSMPAEELVPQLVYRARGLDAYANDTLMLSALAMKYLGRVSANFNVALFTEPGPAKELAEKIAADPDNAQSLMRESATGDLEPQLDQDTGPSTLGLRLMVPDNTVMVLYEPPNGQSAGGYVVVQVTSTETSTSVSPEFQSGQVDPSQLPQAGRYVLRERLLDQGIRISPRYGVWDSTEMKVVPKSEAEVSGLLFLPKSDQS
jgi:hypothetical protein